MLQVLQNVQPIFEIDGKQITVDYSKNNYTTAYVLLFTPNIELIVNSLFYFFKYRTTSN